MSGNWLEHQRAQPTSFVDNGDASALLNARPAWLWPWLARDRVVAIIFFAAIAIGTRVSGFGNPILHIDDQFYLLVGKAINQGHYPYIDIWDRKPIGLFLIYAFIGRLGGDGVVQYQFVAALFAVITAMIIYSLGARLAGSRGGLLAGAVYLFTIVSFGGQGGQSPVFYNLLIAAAALQFFEGTQPHANVRFHARIAMTFCGLALTIKQVSVFEGCYIGLAFLSLAQRNRLPFARIAFLAIEMISIALAPTLIAAFVYFDIGALPTFEFAVFTSISLKTSHGIISQLAGIAFTLIFLGPLIIVAIVSAVSRSRNGQSINEHRNFVAGWMAASALGVCAIPNFYDHYNLPLIVPLCVSSATLFARKSGPALATALALLSWSEGSMGRFSGNRLGRDAFERMATDIERNRHGGCIFVASGPPLLYDRSSGCRLTRFLFGEHLMDRTESDAVGVNQAREIRRIFSHRPAIVVRRTYLIINDSSASKDAVAEGLERGYRRIDTVDTPVERSSQRFEIWQRSDLPQQLELSR